MELCKVHKKEQMVFETLDPFESLPRSGADRRLPVPVRDITLLRR